MGGLTESIFNHPVCGADPRPKKVDIRGEDYEGGGEDLRDGGNTVALRLKNH